jgi:WS/DGAT/MGAT family acyltransferase
MGASEAVMWRAEGDLRTRSSGALLEILDSPPDWARFRAAHERAVAAIPRLRDRVVLPLLPVVAPTWAPDRHFELDYHVQRLRVAEPGSMRDVLDLAGQLCSRTLDTNRPQWEAFLIEGMADGRAAYLLKLHHALSDGLGMVQLLEMAHSTTKAPGGNRLADHPETESSTDVNPWSVLVNRLTEEITGAPGRLAGAARTGLDLVGRTARDPFGTVRRGVDYGLSLRRMLDPPRADRSPLLNTQGVGYRLALHDLSLAELKAAGKAASGSVNDAYLAGVLGTFRRYHEHFGIRIEQMPMGIPISLRDSNDPLGGNKFTGARIIGPVGEADPARRIKQVRELILATRAEPAIGFLDLISPALAMLPSAALTEVVGTMTKVSDVQASNIPGLGQPVYLAGSQVEGMYPIGPRPGVAAMVTMVSYDGTCCIGVNFDPEAITDLPVFERCLREGFEEVLAVGH